MIGTQIVRRLGVVLSTALAAPASAGTLPVDLRLTASTALVAGVVPGKSYRVVYAGGVTGTLTGEFTHVLCVEPETTWWPAAEVAWDSLFITTPRGSLTLSLASARLTRGEASDAAPWSGTATWVAEGGTGSFAGVTGRGTLAITAGTDPAASANRMTETLSGTLTLDTTPPTIKRDVGGTRTPRLGPNGRPAVEIDIADAAPASGLRLVDLQGENAAVMAINGEPAASAVPYRQEFLPGTAIRRWVLLVESTNDQPPAIEASVADWAGNTARP